MLSRRPVQQAAPGPHQGHSSPELGCTDTTAATNKGHQRRTPRDLEGRLLACLRGGLGSTR